MIGSPVELHGEPESPAVVPEPDSGEILTVAKGGGIAFTGSISERIVNYGYSTALIWGIGPESFGLFTLAMAICYFIGVISNLGLAYGIIRFGTIHTGARGRTGTHQATMSALAVTLPVGLLAALLVTLGSSFLANVLFKKPELAPLIRALGLSIPFLAVQSTLLAGTRALKVVKYSAIVWVFQPLVALLLAIPILVRGGDVDAVASVYVLSYVLSASLTTFFYLRLIPREYRVMAKFPLGRMVRFSIPLSVTQWFQYVNDRTEVFFLGLLPGAIDVGIYNIAWRIAGLETIFHLSMDQILGPVSSDLSHRQDMEKLDTLYKTTTKWAFTGALLLFLIFCFASTSIMKFFSASFVVGAGVLVVLAFAQLVNAATGSCNTILIMSGHSDMSLFNTIVLFAVSIASDWTLIPRYGLSGAAAAGAASVILVNIMRVVEVWWKLKIQPFKWSFAKPAMAGLLGFGAVSVLRTFLFSGGLLVDMGYSVLLGSIYVTVIYLLKLDNEDLYVLRAIGQKLRVRRFSSRPAL